MNKIKIQSNKSNKSNNRNGFTLTELIFSISIFILIFVAIGAFARDVFFFNNILQSGLNNIGDARKVLRPFANEVRKAQPSDLGSFTISEASTSTFSFYSDIDEDGSRERVKYFLDGDVFKKGVINPSGDPLEYDSNDEIIFNIANNVVATSTVFSYYDSNYYGSTSSTALSYPIVTSEVRLVRIDLTIDANPDRAPSLLTITTQATIRNLKDNYEAI